MQEKGKIKDIAKIKSILELMERASWLRGKKLSQVFEEIAGEDNVSRVHSKGSVGTALEKGFFNIPQNSRAEADIPHLGVEIKTCPLKYNGDRTRLSIKEPLSLNIINYFDEDKCEKFTDSALYKKNAKILFIFYIHDFEKERSEYLIKYVFLWNMNEEVLSELSPDYEKIKEMIRGGKAHEIHQHQHKYLTICPKHGGTFRDPNCTVSKRNQPHSEVLAELRAFRLKNKYMNLIVSRHLGKPLKQGGWEEK
jgi:DNA mismatch repair protein MutH